MKIVSCPFNGPRNIQEFAFGGDVADEPLADAPLDEWANYVFYDENCKASIDEWWFHVPSGQWIIVRRDRGTDEIVSTYAPIDYFQQHRPAK